jgi:hypothetical protein
MEWYEKRNKQKLREEKNRRYFAKMCDPDPVSADKDPLAYFHRKPYAEKRQKIKN